MLSLGVLPFSVLEVRSEGHIMSTLFCSFSLFNRSFHFQVFGSQKGILRTLNFHSLSLKISSCKKHQVKPLSSHFIFPAQSDTNTEDTICNLFPIVIFPSQVLSQKTGECQLHVLSLTASKGHTTDDISFHMCNLGNIHTLV